MDDQEKECQVKRISQVLNLVNAAEAVATDLMELVRRAKINVAQQEKEEKK